MNGQRAALSTVLDELEFHRAVGVEARLARAIEVERDALADKAPDLQMRARLVEADMRLRTGQATEAAHLATEVNRWASEHGQASLLARSHLILSSIFESVGDPASSLDHALRGLELLDDDTPVRTRGIFLIRLADALAVGGSLGAARERYREAEQLFVTIGDVERQVSVLNNLAYAEYEGGDPRRAWDAAEGMRRLAETDGLDLAPPLLDTLARAYIGIGDDERAKVALESALEIMARLGDVEADTPAEIMLTLAELHCRGGQLDAAQATLERCRLVSTERSLGSTDVDILRVQAEIQAAAGHFAEAYETYRSFHTESMKLSSARREASARTRQALFETAEARHEAQRFWRQARTDALTGLPNRRFVDEEMPRVMNDVVGGTAVVVAIVDADHFKRVNDTLSHGVGDRVICELAKVLQAALPVDPLLTGERASFVARLGGEEFLVALPGLDPVPATEILMGMRAAVASHEWGPLIGRLSLNVSIGATVALLGDSQSTILARADRNLYVAKAAGRNRVVADERPARPPEAAPSLAPAVAGAAR